MKWILLYFSLISNSISIFTQRTLLFCKQQLFQSFSSSTSIMAQMERKKGEWKNRGVVYKGPRKVVVEELPYPSFKINTGGIKRHCEHGVIIKMIASGICGTDGHMFKGRTQLRKKLHFVWAISSEIFNFRTEFHTWTRNDRRSSCNWTRCGDIKSWRSCCCASDE